MDRFGRKATIQLGALFCFVGATLHAAAHNLAMILVGCILAGWAIGLMSLSAPVYHAECVHPRSRGMIVGTAQQMIGMEFIVSTYDLNQDPKDMVIKPTMHTPAEWAIGLFMHRLQANFSGGFRSLSKLYRHCFWESACSL